MAHTYDELRKKTIEELREIAREAAVQGYTQMNKEHLLPAVCKALGIDAHHHVIKAPASGTDKASLKGRLRQLKAERDKAKEAHDHGQLKSLRRQIHRINHQIRAVAK